MYKIKFNLENIRKSKYKCYNIDLDKGEMDVVKATEDSKIIKDYKKIIKDFLIAKLFFILGFIFYAVVLYLNSIRIDNIIFENQYKENEEILIDIKSNMNNYMGFKTITNIKELSSELRIKYDYFEWIELLKKGNDLYVEIIKCDYYEKRNNEVGDIIASKDGIIKEMVVTKGLSQVYYNKYVKKGDVLISSLGKYHASGKMIAEVSYYKEIKVKKNDTLFIYDSYDECFGLTFFNKSFIFNKNKSNCDIIEMYSKNLGFMKIKKYSIKRKVTYNFEYDFESAKKHSLNLINEILIDTKIIDILELSNKEDNEYYYFNYYIKTNEDIAIFRR